MSLGIQFLQLMQTLEVKIMIIMQLHNWFDDDVDSVRWDEHKDIIEIILKETNEGSLLLSKGDIIALAKEFNLIVYDKNSNF